MPLPLTIGTGRSLLAQDRVQAFRSLLKRYATHAWFGPDATTTGWVDCVSGVNAANGGSGTTLGNLNGIQCPVFNGSGYYTSNSATISRAFPNTVVVVYQVSSASSAFARLFDARNTAEAGVYIQGGGNAYTAIRVGGGGGEFGTVLSTANTPLVGTFAFALGPGAASLSVNSATQTGTLSADPGASGIVIGGRQSLGNLITGSIALVAVFDSSKITSASIIANTARNLIGV